MRRSVPNKFHIICTKERRNARFERQRLGQKSSVQKSATTQSIHVHNVYLPPHSLPAARQLLTSLQQRDMLSDRGIVRSKIKKKV